MKKTALFLALGLVCSATFATTKIEGTIAAVNTAESSVTIATKDGSVKDIKIKEKTHLRAYESDNAKLADLQIGDNIVYKYSPIKPVVKTRKVAVTIVDVDQESGKLTFVEEETGKQRTLAFASQSPRVDALDMTEIKVGDKLMLTLQKASKPATTVASSL
jgi:hypothetical protein